MENGRATTSQQARQSPAPPKRAIADFVHWAAWLAGINRRTPPLEWRIPQLAETLWGFDTTNR